MGVTELLLVSMLGGSVFSSAGIQHFPGSYFDSRVRVPYQRNVMAGWPGPGRLLEIWGGGDLSEDERVAWLLGAPVFHDPSLLPAYSEAVLAESQRLRQAAAYGYRDLIADRLPDVTGGINDETARLFHQEILLTIRALRRNSLPEIWLQSALAHDGASFPGWVGLHLNRPRSDCFRAVERLVDVGDLGLLVEAYRLSVDQGARISLLKLIEATSLSRFIIKPSGDKSGWGAYIYDDALAALDKALRQWSPGGCAVDGEVVLLRNLKKIGVGEGELRTWGSQELWLDILKRGFPRWWKLAARRLYESGGPWYELSALDADGARNQTERDALLRWFTPPPPRRQPRRPYTPQ
jgi:hypothetical protein